MLGGRQLCMGCLVPDPEPCSHQALPGLQVSRTAMLISFCRKLWQRVCSESWQHLSVDAACPLSIFMMLAQGHLACPTPPVQIPSKISC